MIVFSSDIPHFEGFADPGESYGDLLAATSTTERAVFLGGTMLDVFKRTGQPLNVAT